jgi:hypothetical protein
MVCDYFIETCIIIDYYNVKGEICKMVTHVKRKKGFLHKQYSNFDKYVKKIEEKIGNTCYTKTIYDHNKWYKDNYQEKYESKLKKWFPKIATFIKIYKDSISWPVRV